MPFTVLMKYSVFPANPVRQQYSSGSNQIGVLELLIT